MRFIGKLETILIRAQINLLSSQQLQLIFIDPQMKTKSPKQYLNVVANPQYELKQKPELKKSQNIQKSISIEPQKTQQLPFPAPSPKKHEQLKKVQNQIEYMKNKILLLKKQLQKEQQTIKMNKSKTEQIIRKKINVNKIQIYKGKDNSEDVKRAQMLRVRNASLRESHQNQMQNILKAIYLVKLDDAREIKSLSQSHRKKIMEMNEATYSEQVQKKNRIAQEKQKAKQKYQRYWREKLISIYEGENKVKHQIEKTVNEKKEELKQLRQQEIKLLENMNKVQSKQAEAKKEYLAALSLPVKDVAEALNRSKSSMDESYLNEKKSQSMSRMNSEISKTKKNQTQLIVNFSRISSLDNSMMLRDRNEIDRHKQNKVPNSNVNKQKLKIILKQLKRLEKKQKQQKNSTINS